jgi:hypothetical protein
VQLHHLQHDRVPAPDRAAGALSPADRSGGLARYTFNTGVAQHLFCRTCGIKSYYIPRSKPRTAST